ncbi:hypothetical protein BV898_19401 [Hypsibius exemplaris]|uniref:Uncharacterized protein n=1 Tax=Hypsibius exemplaris TaxID=2072580 RepID=A0A9X6NQN1_HYPEX|nr:hypothetical protein BV898_19401 [Hypsibius exemplaris]
MLKDPVLSGDWVARLHGSSVVNSKSGAATYYALRGPMIRRVSAAYDRTTTQSTWEWGGEEGLGGVADGSGKTVQEAARSMVETWWKHGGNMVETWWKHGGSMVEAWWKHGGSMVETWWKHGGNMGDTIIALFHAQGGPNSTRQKWNVECLDGEAMGLSAVWCKFTFPLKEPSQGAYPFYSGCHVRNFTEQPTCYDPLNHSGTVNTFITGMWNNAWYWYTWNAVQPYKCCKTPLGYYIDYVSCYYQPTHDVFFEYYDNLFHFLVYCAQGFVMTGLARKTNQYSREPALDWIQCCRVGLGRPFAMAPPVVYSKSGAAAYYAPQGSSMISPVSAAYQAQYRSDYGATNATYQENVRQIGSRSSVRDQRADRKLAREVNSREIRPELFHARLEQRAPRPGTKEFRAIQKAYDESDDMESVRLDFKKNW